VAVALAGGSFDGAVLATTLAEVLAAFPAALVAAVDIPIGLPPPFPRRADVTARAALGSRGSSVFSTYPRAVYTSPTHAAAVSEARRLVGQGISQQAWRLGPRILEAASLEPGRVVEVHPELSFAHMVGVSLPSKHTWRGTAERLEALRRQGIELPADAPVGTTPAADLLDAAAVAWSAQRIARGQACCYPPGRAPGEPQIMA